MQQHAQTEYFDLIVKTQAGLENILAQELRACGATDLEIITRAVKCRGDNEVMYKVNYLCRTAMKVLKPIANFVADSEDYLYKQCRKIAWEAYLSTDKTFAVDATVNSPHFTHSKYASLRVKDAIADYFRAGFGLRPNVNPVRPHVQINLHIYKDQCTISLDSSGDSLHKRHYRIAQGEAPINEVLASGLILLSGWDRKMPFYDPMCGSGTILMEAAMIGMNIPAGYYRKYFGFQGWFDYDAELLRKIMNDASQQIEDNELEIYGSDISKEVVEIAKKNLRNAKLHKDVEVRVAAMEDVNPEKGKGIVVMNPPYNERIELDDQIKFYKMIGNSLKRNFEGFNAWIVTSNMGALKFVGLRPSQKIKLFNGPLECRFAKFELYRGTKKLHKML